MLNNKIVLNILERKVDKYIVGGEGNKKSIHIASITIKHLMDVSVACVPVMCFAVLSFIREMFPSVVSRLKRAKPPPVRPTPLELYRGTVSHFKPTQCDITRQRNSIHDGQPREMKFERHRCFVRRRISMPMNSSASPLPLFYGEPIEAEWEHLEELWRAAVN